MIRAFGPPETMQVEEVPAPSPGSGDVLVEVHAVSVNRTLDLAVREGRYARPVALPHVLGADPSGVVVAVGPGVTLRKPGDRVFVAQRLKPATATEGPVLLGVQVWGGYAEYVAVPAANTILIPDGLDFPAATLAARHGPMAFGLLRRAGLKAGETVLVMGAAGGLGSAAVQVAKSLGATVIAAAGTPERVAAALALGADFGIDYRAAPLEAGARRLTGGRGVDVVVENIGDPDLFPGALASLARHGRLATAGAHGGGTVALDLRVLYLRQLTIVGSTEQSAEDTAASLAAAADGRLRGLIHAVLPLRDAVEAHRIAEDRATIGKVVLDPTRH